MTPRLPEPQDTSWDRITFEYELDRVVLLPRNLEVDRFADADEIDFDCWTLTIQGELLNGGEPDITSVYATRFDGVAHRNEPITGALEALFEAYIYAPHRRDKMKQYAIDNGERHFRRAA